MNGGSSRKLLVASIMLTIAASLDLYVAIGSDNLLLWLCDIFIWICAAMEWGLFLKSRKNEGS